MNCENDPLRIWMLCKPKESWDLLIPKSFMLVFFHFRPDSPVSAMFCNANLRSDGQPVGELSMGQQPVESSSSLPVFFQRKTSKMLHTHTCFTHFWA